MAEESVNVTPDEVLVLVRKQLTAFKFLAAETTYRQIEAQAPNHPLVKEIRRTIGEFLQFRFAEFLKEGEQVSDHYHSYLAGIAKKIDITRDVPGFSEIAKRIVDERKSLLYYDRLYTLYQAIENTRNAPGDVVELGVYRGGSLKFIAQVCRHFGLSRRVYGLDTFAGHAGASDVDFSQRTGQFDNTSLDQVRAYVGNEAELVPGDARETLGPLLERIGRVAFAHIDMDLHEPTRQALDLLVPRLAPGAMIVVDDYGFTTCAGVRKAIDEFVAETGFQRIHLMTGQCLLLRPSA